MRCSLQRSGRCVLGSRQGSTQMQEKFVLTSPFLQSSELGPPHPPPPHPQARVSPHFFVPGEAHSLAGEGVGGPNSQKGTDTVTYAPSQLLLSVRPRQDGIRQYDSEPSSLMASVMVSNSEEQRQDGAHHQHGQLRLGEARRVILPQARHLHISSIKETASLDQLGNPCLGRGPRFTSLHKKVEKKIFST